MSLPRLLIGLIEVLVELILLSPLPFGLCPSLSVIEKILKVLFASDDVGTALLPVPGFCKVVDCQDAGLPLRLEINIRMEILNGK